MSYNKALGGNKDISGKIHNMQIAENGHCTLICTEGALIGSKIKWFKDKETLNSTYRLVK